MWASSFSAGLSYDMQWLSTISLLTWRSYQPNRSIGGVSSRTANQFARALRGSQTSALRGSQTSACARPSLRHQQTDKLKKFQPERTSPPSKMSPSVWRVFTVLWGSNTEGKRALLDHPFGSLCMQQSLESLSTRISVVSVNFSQQNPNPNSAIF